jgi:hypothetical protein
MMPSSVENGGDNLKKKADNGKIHLTESSVVSERMKLASKDIYMCVCVCVYMYIYSSIMRTHK